MRTVRLLSIGIRAHHAIVDVLMLMVLLVGVSVGRRRPRWRGEALVRIRLRRRREGWLRERGLRGERAIRRHGVP